MEFLNDIYFWKFVIVGTIIICVGYIFLKGNLVAEAPIELELLEDFEDLSRDIKNKATLENIDAFWNRIDAFAEWHCRHIDESIVLLKVKELSVMLTRIEGVHPAYN